MFAVSDRAVGGDFRSSEPCCYDQNLGGGPSPTGHDGVLGDGRTGRGADDQQPQLVGEDLRFVHIQFSDEPGQVIPDRDMMRPNNVRYAWFCRAQFTVGVDERAAPEVRLVEPGPQPVEDREHLALRCDPVLGHISGEPTPPAAVPAPQVFLDELLFGRKALVEALELDPGDRPQLVDADGLDAALVEQLLGGVQQPHSGLVGIHHSSH